MPQISESEFNAVPLRAHEFLADVPLHDAWVVELPRPRSNISFADFLRVSNTRLFSAPPVVRGLMKLRMFVGRLFGWDSSSSATAGFTFADRLTPADRAASLVPAGTCDGLFDIVYRFENEQLAEVINGVVHAAAVSALVESADSYRFYFAVYVRNAGRLTPFYMALIDPFRKLIVYPALLRSVRTAWNETAGDFAAT